MIIPVFAVLPLTLLAQQTAPRLLYIYRDSLKQGVDSSYHAIENEGAQACADFRCPNPYLAIESLSGPHEAWWINAFAADSDTVQVVLAYAANRPLAAALGSIAARKAPLIGKPVEGFARYRPDLSRGPAWSVAGARFVVLLTTRNTGPVEGSVWEAHDSMRYVLRTAPSRELAETLARTLGARVFAIRPEWSMPSADWVAADPTFWRAAPVPK
ncbi:MAG TPA: hypothetical protein VFD85_03780 [Gemmatimonadales bacterium]|nr:hypothetical protein [Gemmatimonadales bacterium]